MNRFSARFLLLTLPWLLAGATSAQSPSAATVKETSARDAVESARVEPVSKERLFGTLPVSTKSDDARKFLELAIGKYENVLLEDSVVLAQHATEKDPQFALAFAVLSFAARRDVPNPQALARAKALLPRANPDEQLLVRWMTSVQEGQLLPAISSMNDLLARYPEDTHILYLTAEWLYFQQDYDRSRTMMEKIEKLDPNFAPALNMLGYAYIETGDPNPQKAIASLTRYAQLQPSSPNPEDSLGEVLRYAGRDDESIQHYASALEIDPTFVSARVGIGDTLTLMGKFAEAREQYDKAVPIAMDPRDTLHAEIQKAMVSFWEGHPGEGLTALKALAEKAHQQKEPYGEFEAGLDHALLLPRTTGQVGELEQLEEHFSAPHAGMSESDRVEFLAQTLRHEVRIQANARDHFAARAAVTKLEALARKTGDPTVENCYESARGFVHIAEGELASAADELSADPHSPLVMQQLALIQDQLGRSDAANATRAHSKYMRASTLEWFLVTHAPASASSGAPN